MKNSNVMKQAIIRKNFERAVSDYVAALLEKFGWDAYYGSWVADDCTGVYCYADEYFFNLGDIVYIVDNNVSLETYEEWCEYCAWAQEFRQTSPNLRSWVSGCPRASKQEMESLRKLKQGFEDTIKEYKERY